MTFELYRTEPYRSEFEAQVVAVGPTYLVLDRSCFLPCSVTQAADIGTIEDVPIRGIYRDLDHTQHLVDPIDAEEFAVGDLVVARLNWDRRYRMMRLHTAQHLLVHSYTELHEVGRPVRTRVSPRRARLEIVGLSEPAEIEIDAMSQWVGSIVDQDLPTVYEPDSSLERRWFWHIDGLLSDACEGAHVRSTGEVGDLLLQIVQNVQGVVELQIELSDGAVANE